MHSNAQRTVSYFNPEDSDTSSNFTVKEFLRVGAPEQILIPHNSHKTHTMSRPFSFGVEFEFNLAILEVRDVSDSGLRLLRFTRTEDKALAYEGEEGLRPMAPLETFEQGQVNVLTYKNPVIRHISDTIQKAGFPIDLKKLYRTARVNDITKWHVTTNDSIESPNGPGIFVWIGIEVISPAFDFTAESLKAVEDMCLLLTNNYRTVVNETIGLHVHVGHRSQGFKFQDIQKFIAFLWTFEPMLETLHPRTAIPSRPRLCPLTSREIKFQQ